MMRERNYRKGKDLKKELQERRRKVIAEKAMICNKELQDKRRKGIAKKGNNLKKEIKKGGKELP